VSTIVLTGATSGIGLATARLLAPDASLLILHGRQSAEKVAPLLDDLRLTMSASARVHYLAADFSDLSQVRSLALAINGLTDRIDVLINNAGRAGPSRRTITGDGIEVTFQVNYVGPAALTTMLLPSLGISAPGRIVNVASTTHYSVTLDLDDLDLSHHRYSAYEAYANSKLAQVTFSCWLAAHRPASQLEVVSMHPGVIATKILHEMVGGGGDSPEVGAGHVRYVMRRSGDNGAYYDRRRVRAPNPQALDTKIQAALHHMTSALLREPLDLAIKQPRQHF
jgi:NAD(P)-dependent dehydrogenase (short-subunit alcohol dehydrogenase family)